MKNKIAFIILVFSIITTYSQKKIDSISGIIKNNNTELYTFFKMDDKYLFKKMKRGDTIVLYDLKSSFFFC